MSTDSRQPRPWDADVERLKDVPMRDVPEFTQVMYGFDMVPVPGVQLSGAQMVPWIIAADQLASELQSYPHPVEYTDNRIPRYEQVVRYVIQEDWRMDKPVSLVEVLALHIAIRSTTFHRLVGTVGELAFVLSRARHSFFRSVTITNTLPQIISNAVTGNYSAEKSFVSFEWSWIASKGAVRTIALLRREGGYDALLWVWMSARILYSVSHTKQYDDSAELSQLHETLSEMRKFEFLDIEHLLAVGVFSPSSLKVGLESGVDAEFVEAAYDE